MTAEPAVHVLAPVLGRRIAGEQRVEAAGDRLDRRERVVQLVADDANQPLPGFALLLAQRLADVGEHEQIVRIAALPEPPCAAPPSAPCRRGTQVVRRRAWRRARRSRPSRRRRGRAARRPRCPSRRSPYGSPAPGAARCRTRRSPTSISAITARRSAVASWAPSRCERSVSASMFTSSMTAPSGRRRPPSARADGEVAFAQRRQQVRDRLQRTDDAPPQRHAATSHDPRSAGERDADHDRAMPLRDPRRRQSRSDGEAAGRPRRRPGRQSGDERDEDDAPVVARHHRP